MMSIPLRVYALARELNLESGDVFRAAQRLGFDVKDILSVLSAEQKTAIVTVLTGRRPDEPPLEIASKPRPRGPRPKAASQRLTPPPADQED